MREGAPARTRTLRPTGVQTGVPTGANPHGYEHPTARHVRGGERT